MLPAVPTDLGPQLPQNNGTYEGLSRDYNTLGPMGLWEMSIASFFPVGRRYSFMPADALDRWVEVCGLLRAEPPQDAAVPDHHSGWERRLPA